MHVHGQDRLAGAARLREGMQVGEVKTASGSKSARPKPAKSSLARCCPAASDGKRVPFFPKRFLNTIPITFYLFLVQLIASPDLMTM
jgi:hypothetical protein